jgi:hypothetical protein
VFSKVENTTFRKLDLLLSSGEWGEYTYSAGSLRESYPPMIEDGNRSRTAQKTPFLSFSAIVVFMPVGVPT